MDNKIKHFRTKQKMSQRELAQRIDTSQQQVQRYENAISPIKFETAIKLCQTLGVTVEQLFPPTHEVLAASRKRGNTTEEALRDKDVQAGLLRAGVEIDPREWSFKGRLRNGLDFQFPLFLQRKDRLRWLLWNSEREERSFIWFKTPQSEIAINLQHVLFGNLTWDVGRVSSQVTRMAEVSPVKIWLSSSLEPQSFFVPDDTEEEGSMNQFLMGLESIASDERVFFYFEDVDGEEVYFRIDDIAMIDVPLTVTHPELPDDLANIGINRAPQAQMEP